MEYLQTITFIYYKQIKMNEIKLSNFWENYSELQERLKLNNTSIQKTDQLKSYIILNNVDSNGYLINITFDDLLNAVLVLSKYNIFDYVADELNPIVALNDSNPQAIITYLHKVLANQLFDNFGNEWGNLIEPTKDENSFDPRALIVSDKTGQLSYLKDYIEKWNEAESENNENLLNFLTDEYEEFLSKNGLDGSADELYHELLSEEDDEFVPLGQEESIVIDGNNSETTLYFVDDTLVSVETNNHNDDIQNYEIVTVSGTNTQIIFCDASITEEDAIEILRNDGSTDDIKIHQYYFFRNELWFTFDKDTEMFDCVYGNTQESYASLEEAELWTYRMSLDSEEFEGRIFEIDGETVTIDELLNSWGGLQQTIISMILELNLTDYTEEEFGGNPNNGSQSIEVKRIA